MTTLPDNSNTRSARNQKAYRDRIRACVQQYIDQLMDDVDVKEEVRDGKRYVNFHSSDATWETLEVVAAAKGTSMDGLIKEAIARHIKVAAKWQLLKDRKAK